MQLVCCAHEFRLILFTRVIVGITVPIIPGIMPIQTYSSFLRLTKLCGTKVPSKVMSELVEIRVRNQHPTATVCSPNVQSSQHDDQKVKDYGVELAVKMIARLTTEAKISGVHLCTLNLEKSVQRVLSKLGWGFLNDSKFVNKLITVSTYAL